MMGIAEPKGAPYGGGMTEGEHKVFAEYDKKSVTEMRSVIAGK